MMTANTDESQSAIVRYLRFKFQPSFKLKIHMLLYFNKISIFSNNGHLGQKAMPADTKFERGQPNHHQKEIFKCKTQISILGKILKNMEYMI